MWSRAALKPLEHCLQAQIRVALTKTPCVQQRGHDLQRSQLRAQAQLEEEMLAEARAEGARLAEEARLVGPDSRGPPAATGKGGPMCQATVRSKSV